MEKWIKEGKKIGAKYLISVCDMFDWSDYPVYVMSNESLSETKEKYQNRDKMSKINEIIDLEKEIKTEKEIKDSFYKFLKNIFPYSKIEYGHTTFVSLHFKGFTKTFNIPFEMRKNKTKEFSNQLKDYKRYYEEILARDFIKDWLSKQKRTNKYYVSELIKEGRRLIHPKEFNEIQKEMLY